MAFDDIKSAQELSRLWEGAVVVEKNNLPPPVKRAIMDVENDKT